MAQLVREIASPARLIALIVAVTIAISMIPRSERAKARPAVSAKPEVTEIDGSIHRGFDELAALQQRQCELRARLDALERERRITY